MRHQVAEDLVDFYMPPKTFADQWDAEGLYAAVIEKMGMDLPIIKWADEEGVDQAVMKERLIEESDKLMAEKLEAFGVETMRNIEKQLLLQTIDGKWREHLMTLEHLRTVIGFRGYAQRDPLNEYKTEAFTLFESMLNSLRQETTQKLAMVRPLSEEEQQAMIAQFLAQQQAAGDAAEGGDEQLVAQGAGGPAPASGAPLAGGPRLVGGTDVEAEVGGPRPGFDENDPTTWGNPSRNDLCPCGSGKRFKHCHGRGA